MGRYTFYDTPNKVVCVSTFAKRKVRGVAKCSPEDKFDFKIGHKLAQLRCDKKVAEKRWKKAKDRYEASMDKFANAQKEYVEAIEYWRNSCRAFDEAIDNLEEFEKLLGKNT